MKTLINRIRNCDSGATAMELALMTPVFMALITGIMELAMILFVAALMEGGLRDASRFGITGFEPEGATREARILDIVSRNTAGLVDMNSASVETLIYPSFGDIGGAEPFIDSDPANGSYDAGETFTDVNGNGEWDPDMGAAGIGGPGDVVVYRLSYDWSLLTPMLTGVIGEGGKIRLAASVVVRNEPFDSAAGGPLP
jgi:Flp pilus assembly protein TadG